jgi:hypothetical protein
MGFKYWADSKVKRLDWIDMALVKLSSICLGVLLAVLIPSLTGFRTGLLIAFIVILAVRPLYRAYVR